MNKPLRKVLFREQLKDYLECGHILSTPTDIIGNYYPEKRRCYKCQSKKDVDYDVESTVKYESIPLNRSLEELKTAPIETLSIIEVQKTGRYKEVLSYLKNQNRN